MKLPLVRRIALVAVWLVLDSAASGSGQDELSKLQGTWQLVAVEVEGETLPNERTEGYTIRFDRTTYMLQDRERVFRNVGFRVEPSKDPKQISWVQYVGPNKGKPILGIYKFQDGMLLICHAGAGLERPSEFATKPGRGHCLRVFKKIEPAKE